MEAKVQVYPQSFTLQQEYNKKTYTAGGRSGRDKDGVAGDEAPESAGRVAIHVTNTTASGAVPIAYRMLTTDRQRFTVSPREGIVPPGATHTILISLNAPRAVSSGGGDEGEGVAPNKKGGAASAERCVGVYRCSHCSLSRRAHTAALPRRESEGKGGMRWTLLFCNSRPFSAASRC